MAKKPETTAEIAVLPVETGIVSVLLVGVAPLICNSMSVKAQRELLFPSGRKTAADRAVKLKHEPLEEYRASLYRAAPDQPTALGFPAPGVKGALMTAALDQPGTKKTEIGRLCWVRGYLVPLYGIPEIFLSVVRSADMNRTPDVRSRALIRQWCLKVDIEFVKPKLTARAVVNLLAAAGLTCGIGDYRQEKGRGSFGQFRLADADDAEAQAVIAATTREGQLAALADPAAYDESSAELLAWFDGEVERTGRGKEA